MRSVHILHHSISPFAGQFSDGDPLHFNTGIPMLFARAIRAQYPDCEVEVWRPERTLREPYIWQDNDEVIHRVFPSLYVRYKLEISRGLISAAKNLANDERTYVWVHGIYNLHAYLLAGALHGRPVIAQSHGGFPAKAMFSISRHRWLRYLYCPLDPIERVTLPKYPQFFAIGTEEIGYLQTILQIPKDRISLSPTGIDFNHFRPGNKREARRVNNLDGDIKIILYVGRFASEKGIDSLIDAFSLVSAKVGRSRLLIVGGGPLEEALRSQVRRLGLEDSVDFIGYVRQAELPDWYRAADVTVIPSPIDWFPKVAMESMACGTPIVITEGGGAPDIVREFECGLLAPLRDSAGLAERIAAILLDAAYPHPNIARARQAFDWSVKLPYAFGLLKAMADGDAI